MNEIVYLVNMKALIYLSFVIILISCHKKDRAKSGTFSGEEVTTNYLGEVDTIIKTNYELNYDKSSKAFRIESGDGTIPSFPFSSERFSENNYDVSKTTGGYASINYEPFVGFSNTVTKQVILDNNSLFVRFTYSTTDDNSLPETLQYVKVFKGVRID